MFDALPPQEVELADSLRPKVEVVAEDTTKRDLDFDLSGAIFIGSNGAVVPTVTNSIRLNGVSASTFVDAGFIGDPKREGILGGGGPDPYMENFVDWNTGIPLRPSIHTQFSHYDQIGRIGAGTGPLSLGPLNLSVNAYPLSTKKDEDGRMESEVIVRSGMNIGNGFSLNGMLRRFDYIGDDKGPRHLGIFGLDYELDRKTRLKAQYRNFPTKGKMGMRNRGYLFLGCQRRF
ncbi:MAG: hypothetical protein JSV63_04085 [Candidatus Aenigmatarchaeota archaeon]|nr:MAG: hypothetical protein JSV63_04085 [Candidatus Aenigmarchaeota archaeon]